ncbi:CPBP family intramembrane glutamic endopeptidase [Glycomyces algeriensis]|uniref:CAAX amino protease n=1 Tax=Glycomyces algeriensis TaxID=256037 RepID=A0A9W6G4B4_9ACTN|nr:CPBP family intramembrane glutamic endopeptidase [Glycomyces algeriensis]MDA1368714.1 CPBP family intramembrane metalloprotease [Glycomyces algeriensis]MDR7352513.1 membrane protease YdiL (CAAX protease family) [Glycomyces algeriensis]GLI40196.1 CAAX amino protease [Glycomyces algeriensis]
MKLVWQLLAVGVVTFVGGQATVVLEGRPWLVLIVGLVTSVLAVIVYRWVVKLTERRQVAELAGPGAFGAVSLGTLLGVAMFGAVIANIAFLGHYTVDGIGSPSGAIGLIGFMAAAAVTEELLFRGVLLRIIEGRFGTWIALASTSIVFGLIHLVNPNATLWGAIAIAIEAGGMLGAAYIATRSLWLPIGLHFGWNIAASAIFSTEVSGNGTPQGLLDAATSGPTLVSGGAFGPEGSIYAVGFGTVLMVVFLWIAKRRGHIVPPRRRAERAGAAATLPR